MQLPKEVGGAANTLKVGTARAVGGEWKYMPPTEPPATTTSTNATTHADPDRKRPLVIGHGSFFRYLEGLFAASAADR
ncbi:MAG: hypothetical protein L3K17_05760 [Thermoplasmata archaeon]|nr:hypothetical protein [Thermoplasmata archaeon]